MNAIMIGLLFAGYLLSAAGLVILSDVSLQKNLLTEKEYRQGVLVSSIPALNTLALLVCLLSVLTHWVCTGTWAEKTEI